MRAGRRKEDPGKRQFDEFGAKSPALLFPKLKLGRGGEENERETISGKGHGGEKLGSPRCKRFRLVDRKNEAPS